MSPARIMAFFASRWRGEVPPRIVLWRDMLGVGTVVNIVATFTALMAASNGAPAWLAAAIHFGPLPYNLFLFAVVEMARAHGILVRLLAIAWLLLMTVV